MKGILFYNPYSKEEMILKQETETLGLHIEFINIFEEHPFKKYVRATPCLITIRDDLQGEFLHDDNVSMKDFIASTLVFVSDQEYNNIYGQEQGRFDNYIRNEKDKAIDDYTLEQLEGGLL